MRYKGWYLLQKNIYVQCTLLNMIMVISIFKHKLFDFFIKKGYILFCVQFSAHTFLAPYMHKFSVLIMHFFNAFCFRFGANLELKFKNLCTSHSNGTIWDEFS